MLQLQRGRIVFGKEVLPSAMESVTTTTRRLRKITVEMMIIVAGLGTKPIAANKNATYG